MGVIGIINVATFLLLLVVFDDIHIEELLEQWMPEDLLPPNPFH